jgi:hypothetical protein
MLSHDTMYPNQRKWRVGEEKNNETAGLGVLPADLPPPSLFTGNTTPLDA